MRSAFTLVEVLIAAAIASIAGVALLQMNSSNTLLFTKLKGLSQISEELALIGTHADERFNRSSKSLYDLLDKRYEIDNDDFRKYLKSKKYDYTETLVDTISFEGSDLDEEDDEIITEQDIENAASAPLIQFELIKVMIKDKTTHGAILKVRPL